MRLDLAGAHVLFTGRDGGVSEGAYASLNVGPWTQDDPAAIAANHDLLAVEAGVARSGFAWSRQVHGIDVRAHLEPPDEAERDDPADGHATRLPGVAATVFAADCLPIALSTGDAVAMLHAGWRGLAAGIVERGVATLRGLGARGDLVAAIGPGAGACCYEAGPEVHAAVGHSRGANVDLKAAAAERLRAAGARDVQDSGICTIHDERFFSHRRSGGVTGRQAGVAWLGA